MMNKEKILRALELADSIMDYCGGMLGKESVPRTIEMNLADYMKK